MLSRWVFFASNEFSLNEYFVQTMYMKVTYLGRWGRLVLGERGLERCQGSAGRLNRSPGDDDEEEDKDFVGGDEMFFSPYKGRVQIIKMEI